MSFDANATGHDHDDIIVGDDDVARHDQRVAAGDRHVDGERDDVRLRVVVGRDTFYPDSDVEPLGPPVYFV
jgi:hypothetical protein